MADTTNYDFTLLDGTDYAGFTSINTLINSIDTILKERAFRADKVSGDENTPDENDVMIFKGAWGSSGYWTSGLVDTSNIASNAITNVKMADNSVNTAELVNASVTNAKLASNAVTTDKITDDAVTTDKLADQSVTAAKLNANLTTQLLPSGMIAPFAGTTAPTGWLLCDGSALDSDANPDYSGLWDVLGTTYGGTDTSNFNLPDMQGRVPAGLDGSAEFTALNVTGGSKTVTLTANESGLRTHQHPAGSTTGNNASISISPAGGHGHNISDPGHSHNVSFPYKTYNRGTSHNANALEIPGAGGTGVATQGTTSSGTSISIVGVGDHNHSLSQSAHTHSFTTPAVASSNAIDAHTNLQPYITLNYIIKI